MKKIVMRESRVTTNNSEHANQHDNSRGIMGKVYGNNNRVDGGMTERWINRIRYNWGDLTLLTICLD
jgi:hypothetical protein